MEPLTGIALIMSDLGTVLTSVLSNATSLVNWVAGTPLVYIWVIFAILFVIIAFVKGFIRG